jgi:hypothetical protein
MLRFDTGCFLVGWAASAAGWPGTFGVMLRFDTGCFLVGWAASAAGLRSHESSAARLSES